jgi:hypothetical protein
MLPGGLKVPRRVAAIADRLARDQSGRDLTTEWLAIAVNEENAAGNRIVTAPTNGAADIIPAVLTYCERFIGATERDVRVFLLTAGMIGTVVKRNASISGAELGCPSPTQWRWPTSRLARHRHRNDAPKRQRHVRPLQGDLDGRPRGQRRRMLKVAGVRAEHFVVDVLPRYVPRDQRVADGGHER